MTFHIFTNQTHTHTHMHTLTHNYNYYGNQSAYLPAIELNSTDGRTIANLYSIHGVIMQLAHSLSLPPEIWTEFGLRAEFGLWTEFKYCEEKSQINSV